MPGLSETLRKEITEKSPADFIADYLFDRVPHVFASRHDFVMWKRRLALGLEVDAADLTIVGSGATGVSLSPHKNFSEFGADSDIDVAVVSNHHFTLGWRFLRNNPQVRAKLDSKTRAAWDDHVTRLIYWGTLATDRLLGLMPFGEAWLKATSAITLDGPTKGKDINLRIYSDYVSLRAYQIHSVTKLRNDLLSPPPSE